MKSANRLHSIIFFLLVLVGHQASGQSGMSLKYIRDYVQAKPKIGIVFSYDSIFLEATLKDISAKGGLGEAMGAGLALQTVASQKAYARYEALTAPGIATIANFGNITNVTHDDDLMRGGYKAHGVKANALMKKEGVGLLIHVIFGGKFTKESVDIGKGETKDAYILHGQINYRFYVDPKSGLSPNYLQAPVLDIAYQYGTDESQKDWTSEQVQQYLADQHLADYARMLERVKTVLETEANFNSKPIGIVRVAEDNRRVTVQTNIPVEGEGGLLKTLDDVSDVYGGNYHVSPNAFWMSMTPASFSEGVVIAQIKGDNKSTPSVVETSYPLPIARLIAREGDMSAAICRVRKLPNGLELKDLVGMAVFTEAQLNWTVLNPSVPENGGDFQIDKSKPIDEAFLKNPPPATPPISAFLSLNSSEPTKEVKDKNDFVWPMKAYSGNAKVIPATNLNTDASEFTLDKVRSISEAVKILDGKGYKIGMVFAPYESVTGGVGIVKHLSDADVNKFLSYAEKLAVAPTGSDNKSKLSKMGLIEKAYFPISGKLLDAGQGVVNALNEKYQTKAFELVDGSKLPIGKAKLASKSKAIAFMSNVSGGAMDIPDLSKTQYKLLGNYELKVDKDKIKIENQVNIYQTGTVGLEAVGDLLKLADPKTSISLSGNLDEEYEKVVADQKSLISILAETIWEGKPFTIASASYSDKEMLHPSTVINASAKPNIVPKKEKTLLEKVRRYETEGNKIGIILDPGGIIAQKDQPQQSMINPALAADTIDCVFDPGNTLLPDQYLYLGHKLQKKLNEAFSTEIFEVIDKDALPKTTAKYTKIETPTGLNTQYKIIVTLSLSGSYKIVKAGSGGMSFSGSSSSSTAADAKKGKYEMVLNVISQFVAEEYDNESEKNKKVTSKITSFMSDRFLTNDCPTGIDDFIAVVGSPEDFFAAYEVVLDDDLDKVIKKEMK